MTVLKGVTQGPTPGKRILGKLELSTQVNGRQTERIERNQACWPLHHTVLKQPIPSEGNGAGFTRAKLHKSSHANRIEHSPNGQPCAWPGHSWSEAERS